MKCPFCQQELEKYYWNDLECYACPDLTCDGYYMTATKDMWQELDRTRKALDESEHCCTEWEKQALDYKAENIKISTALDVAVDALDRMAIHDSIYDIIARNAMKRINEIKALEQKDK